MATHTLVDTDSVQIISNKWLEDVRQYGVNVDTLFKHGTINAALSNIGTVTQTTIVVTENTAVNANTDLTSYPNIKWLFLGAGRLTPATAVTLTLYSPNTIIADPTQFILDNSSGTITFATSGTVYPQWFGAASSATLNKALATGADVCIPQGTFPLTTVVKMSTNKQTLFGMGRASILSNASTSGLFCAIAIIENTTGVQIRDLTLLGNASSEPAGPAPVRGIVLGTNSDGTDHSATSWDAKALIQNVFMSGVTPGTTGFNVCMQLNKGNKSLVKDCVLESMYGTNGNYGYGIVCHGEDIDIVNVRALSTISGQGRHAFYLTSTPMRVRVINCEADGFQSEPFTSNIASGGEGMEFINCISRNSAATAVGSHDACFAFHGGSKGRIVGCRAYGATRSSNNFGVTVKDHNYAMVSDIYMENVDRHGVYIEDADYTQVRNVFMNLPGIEDTALYGGLTIISSNYVVVDGLTVVGPARFVARFDSSGTTPNNCRIRNLLYSGSFSHEIENYSINTNSNIAYAKTIPLVQRADLASAATAMDGTVVIDDNGSGDRNIVFYAGGQRFRIDGGSNV